MCGAMQSNCAANTPTSQSALQALPVTENLARGVVPRYPRHAAARMSGGCALEQTLDWRPIVRPVRDGTLPEQLVRRELPVEDMALRQTHDALEVGWHEHLEINDLLREARRHRI